MLKPKNLLVYYGWLNSFNSASNGWDNKKVALEMAKYNMLVFGAGVEDTTHGDNANINIILPRIKVLNPEAEFYGYVTVSQSYANFKAKVDKWVTNRSVDGIFFDESGYGDPNATVANTSREELNKKIDYVHSKGLKCFINGWKIQWFFGQNSDVSYPDSTWNPNGHDINLNEDDWYMLESFGVTATATYETASQWKSRGEEAVEKVTCNVASIGCIEEGTGDQAKFDFLYTSSLMFEVDAIASGDYASTVSYGASNAKTKFYDRPDFCGLGDTESIDVVQDNIDTDVYWRHLSHGRMKVDFSSGAEASSIDVF